MPFTLPIFLLALLLAAWAQTFLTEAVRFGLAPRNARSSASFFHVVLSDVFTFIPPSGAIRGWL